MLRVYSRVADSGGVVMQKPGLSIVGTRVPAIATTLSAFSHRNQRNPDVDIGPHRNGIFLGGRHLGGRRLLPPDLHHIESASSRWEDDVSPQQNTYIDCTDVRDRLPSTSFRNLNDPQRLGNDGEMRTRLKVGMAAPSRVWCEDLMTGTLSNGTYITTLCYD
jgi:hypothetical protein